MYVPSSSESDMKFSCIDSGATTRYFSSVIDVCIGEVVLFVTDLSDSITLIYPSFCAIFKGVCPF